MLLFAQIVVNYKQMFRKIITYISGDNVLHCIGVNLLFGRHYIVLSAIPDNYKNKWRKTRPVFIMKIKVKVKDYAFCKIKTISAIHFLVFVE